MKEFAQAIYRNGKATLTRRSGKLSSMLMNIDVYALQKGQTKHFCSAQDETAILLISGEISFSYNGKCNVAKRQDFLRENAFCLHFARNTEVTVRALADSEVIVQSTENERQFDAVFYDDSNIRNETFGYDQYGKKAVRQVRTVFDYSTAPYSNLVIGEVVNEQGGWSSYIPHHHDQPEVYYYRFDKPQGFGACFIGDKAYRITDRSYAAISGGKSHPQVTAPGYPMYYVWLIRHLPDNPWTDRVNEKEHEWLLNAKL